jgi:hypothetical protein
MARCCAAWVSSMRPSRRSASVRDLLIPAIWNWMAVILVSIRSGRRLSRSRNSEMFMGKGFDGGFLAIAELSAEAIDGVI